MSALSKIQDAGFELNLVGDSFEVKPASNLNHEQREFLKAHRDMIIAELRRHADFGQRHYCHDCPNKVNDRCTEQNYSIVDAVLWCGFHPKNLNI